MDHDLKFKPLTRNPYYQTIISTAIDFEKNVKSETHFVKLNDNDVLALEISKPRKWTSKNGSVLLVHGLCGSHNSHYMKRLAKKFYKKNIQPIRLNLRGCGSGKGLARKIYHSGCSEDIFEAIKNLVKNFSLQPMVLVGFSLGANVSLKLAGELGDKLKKYLSGVIAVGPPVDLLSSARLFTKPRNKVYADYFIKILMEDVNFIHNHFPDLPPHNLPANITLNEFDELYVAPMANFSSVIEYYVQSSSKKVISNITVPTKILLSRDDPLIECSAFDDIHIPDAVDIFRTNHGGHIGFIGMNIFKDFRWMDQTVFDWVKDMLCYTQTD